MGLIKLTPEEALVQQARIFVCEECETFSKSQRRCIKKLGGCGCFMDAKTRFMNLPFPICPKGKWPNMTKEQVIEFAHTMAVELETE